MAALWIPDVDVFFESLVRVIRGARSHLSTDQVDSAEFWCRRLDEYERTLTLLLSRGRESRPDQETFIRDLQQLTAFLRNLRDMLDSRTFRREFVVDGQDFPQTLRTTDQTGAAGRPRYVITEVQIRMLREEGFRWADIARYFGVSPITLRRRRRECDMPVGENFDHISDDELDAIVAGVLYATPQDVTKTQTPKT